MDAYLDSDIRDLKPRISPLWKVAVLDFTNSTGVRVHGFLFEVSDEPVDDPGMEEVRDEEGVEEDALGSDDHELHEPAGLAHLHER